MDRTVEYGPQKLTNNCECTNWEIKWIVFLLQEAYILNVGIVVVSKFASLVVREMTKHGFNYRTSLGEFVAPYFRNGGGIFTFSRISLARTVSKQYHNTFFDLLNFRHYKGLIIGAYVINTQHLFVTNTHLDNIQAKTKILHARELADQEIKNLPPPAHVMVGGDFHIDNSGPNLDDRSEEYLELLNSVNQTALRSVFPLRGETNFDGGSFDTTFESFNVEIVKKQVIKLVTANREMALDHYGLHEIQVKLL